MVDRQMADVLEPNKKKKKEPRSPCSVGWSDDARRNQRIPLVPFAMGSLEWPPSHAAGPCVPLARGTSVVSVSARLLLSSINHRL